VFIGSADGFVYAFGLGGGVSARPSAAITSPANNSTVPNPGGSLTMSGTASDDGTVTRVLVSVKDRGNSKWWDATARAWSKFFVDNQASLSGQTWSLAFPVGTNGGSFLAYADAVDDDGQHSAPVAEGRFVVASLGSPPDTAITSPRRKQVFNFPASGEVSFPITVQGTATDPGGANPGIAKVNVVVTNIEHQEYWCGPSPCPDAVPGHAGVYWRTKHIVVAATLANPGAASTTWTVTFPVYDHPHKYSISAWAVDRDGETDTTKARVSPICVRDAGIRSCI
jgi:hypothetical protein